MNFQKYARKGEEFVKSLAVELEIPHDTDTAGRILRSTLHVLRDQTSPEESMQLISQLPMMLKAVYVDGWNIGKQRNKVRHVDDFLDRVTEINRESGGTDFTSYEQSLATVKAVFRVVKTYVSDGEIGDLRRTLPEEIRSILDD